MINVFLNLTHTFLLIMLYIPLAHEICMEIFYLSPIAFFKTIEIVFLVYSLQVPRIDMLAGIELYSTKFEGIGGHIKNRNEDFEVTEILHNSVFKKFSKFKTKKNRFPLYVLEKTGLDSNHALIEIRKELGIHVRLLGIKDSKATSLQYCTSEQDTIQNVSTRHTKLRLLGYTEESIRKSHMVGNKFDIRIHETNNNNISDFSEECRFIPNFYGLQRFGSARLVTHMVGRQILKRDFRGAVDLLLCYTTEYDTEFSKEIRERCQDPQNYQSVLRNMPRGMDIERLILTALVNGKKHISALREIPINIRRLFVHAYQAYLFNKCLSTGIKEGENVTECKVGNLCFEIEDQSNLGKLQKFVDSMNPDNVVPATQLAGYSLRKFKDRFEEILFGILSEEGLTPNNFFLREMQELSVEGGFRQLPLMVKDINYEKTGGLKFRLPIGGYATTLLRELMKPSNPIKAGF
jgi:tRNA pseudouridine13 synthase